jgi:predicted transcriptional regulator
MSNILHQKPPDTSLAAYKSIWPEISQHQIKIIKGLQIIKKGTFEDISAIISLDRHQVARRLKELEAMEIVFKQGDKKNTTSGRMAYLYRLRPDAKMPEVFVAEKRAIPDNPLSTKNELFQ